MIATGRRLGLCWMLSASLLAPAAPAVQDPARAAAPERTVLIPLPQPSGQALLMQSRTRADYGPLAEAFLTQANLSYCGVASAVMVLNSLAVTAPPAAGYGPYRFWTQENFFDAPATRRVKTAEAVVREGMTLAELAGLLASHGLRVERWHGEQLSLEQFRHLLRRSLADPGDRLLANYHRPALGQDGGGHIAPIAAYHAHQDQVLLLDVARYRYPSVWVPAAALWQAVRTVDESSGRSRGLLVVRRSDAQEPGGEGGTAPAP